VVGTLGGLEDGNLLWDLLWATLLLLWTIGLHELVVVSGGGWGLVSGSVRLLVGVFSCLFLDTWGSNWSILWSVGTTAWLFLAVYTLWSIGSMAWWEVLVFSVDNNWGPLSINSDGLLVRESGGELGLNESSSRLMNLIPGRFIEKCWGISDLNMSVFLLLVVVLFTLHGDVLLKILISVHSSGEELSVWKALNTVDTSLIAG